MGKFFIILVLALGAGLYFPESREVILERSQPVLNPAYRWMTNQEIRRIVADLEIHEAREERLPYRRGEFDAWLDRRYPQEASRLDAWGTRYMLSVTNEGFRVISAGPDGQFGTPDDLEEAAARSMGTGLQ